MGTGWDRVEDQVEGVEERVISVRHRTPFEAAVPRRTVTDSR